MQGFSRMDSPELPLTSFPIYSSASPPLEPDFQPNSSSFQHLLDSIYPILVISDARECNSNLSIFLKLAVDYLKTQEETYHTCSILALKFLNLNLFIKNHELCLGKILGLMSIFSKSVAGDHLEEALILKEILLIIVLLLFKLSTNETGPLTLSQAIDQQDIFSTLRNLSFIEILSEFIAGHVRDSDNSHASYVILNFNCNIFFQYLYHIILLNDEEFLSLTTCELIPTLIDDLLSNDNFNNYNLAGQDFDDVSKLIAYEEFKLLLLINEQYMMRSISSRVTENNVIEGLLTTRKDSVNGICGFINLLVYHMNREESHIIRIQMLKFLYLIITSPKSSKLGYLNDLKIVVDIIIRELNDLDYSSDRLSQENRLLALAYLKILHPLLTLTQLNEISPKYKAELIVEVLSDVIMNCEAPSNESSGEEEDIQSNLPSSASSILKTATKCLKISWLKTPRKKVIPRVPGLSNIQNSSAESLISTSSLSSKINNIRLDASDSNSSTDSFSMTRVASVRASSISDYNKHTTSHNLDLEDNKPFNIFEANNLNVFRSMDSTTGPYKRSGSLDYRTLLDVSSPFSSVERCPSSAQTLGLLNLPKEYLSKKSLPPIPKEVPTRQSIEKKTNLLQEKARYKKAPPPPPPPSRRRR